MDDFAIYVLGHSRHLHIGAILESLRLQDALKYTHVWIDGHQGNPERRALTDRVYGVVAQYQPAEVRPHNGNLGFRKIIIQALIDAVNRYRSFLILEDDCFPTSQAVAAFREQLGTIESDPSVFSVYGHHFLVPAESETCTRFQSWGWGTTGSKLRPVLDELIDCYALPEPDYLAYVNGLLTPEVVARIDVTPPRQPTNTLRKFFAWDETVTLLTAVRGLVHRKTPQRTIYNFGVQHSSHFRNIRWYRDPPFNMVPIDDIWNYF